MNHTYIEEQGLIDRYHQGSLDPEEEIRFEEHFVDCAQCMEQLEIARGFRTGIRTVAAEDAVRAAVGTGLLARWARGRWMGWAIAGVLMLAATSWWTLQGPGSSSEGPLVNTPVFLLSVQRGGGEPASTVTLDGPGEWVSLAVDTVFDPRFDGYQVTVSRSEGGDVWRRDDLRPNDLEVLMITFPVEFFEPGIYDVSVAGQTMDGQVLPVAEYSFQAVRE